MQCRDHGAGANARDIWGKRVVNVRLDASDGPRQGIQKSHPRVKTGGEGVIGDFLAYKIIRQRGEEGFIDWRLCGGARVEQVKLVFGRIDRPGSQDVPGALLRALD